jgi:hypothetical protein
MKTIREITPRIQDAPKREPLKLLLCRQWEIKPITFILSPWTRECGAWFAWHIVARPMTRYADSLVAARVFWNGGGRDPEIRFQVWAPTHAGFGAFNRDSWGINNDFKRIPECHPLTDDMGPPYGSRGIYPAREGNFLAVVKWADSLVDALYSPLLRTESHKEVML